MVASGLDLLQFSVDHLPLRCTGFSYCDFNPILVCDGNTVLAQLLDEWVDVTVITRILDTSCQMVDEGHPARERWKTPICWLYDLYGLLGWL